MIWMMLSRGLLKCMKKYSTTKLLIKDKPVIKKNVNDKLESVLILPENTERQGEGGLRIKGYFQKSYENKPLITIVTVVYNGAEHLEKTMKSVIEQSYDNVEYIIIDGGSTDGTLEIIKRYKNEIDYWVSEADGGIYDAMNKGIALGNGEWINFMNEGDSFYNDEVLAFVASSDDGLSRGVIYGDSMKIYGGDRAIFKKCKPLISMDRELPFVHQCAFVKTSLAKQHPFDIYYKICADYDFFYRLYTEGVVFKYIKSTIAKYDMSGVSSNYLATYNEIREIEIFYSNGKSPYITRLSLLVIAIKETIKKFLPKDLIAKIQIKLEQGRKK